MVEYNPKRTEHFFRFPNMLSWLFGDNENKKRPTIEAIRKKYEQVPRGPNPFSKDECKLIVTGWQHCVDEDVDGLPCWELSVRALQYCGGLTKLDLHRRFKSEEKPIKMDDAMIREIAKNPTMDRRQIQQEMDHKIKCQRYANMFGGASASDIQILVYHANCGDTGDLRDFVCSSGGR